VTRAAAFQLLCGCLSLDESPAKRNELRRLAQSGSLRWERFIALANEHMIAPAVLHALGRKGIEDALPSDVIDFFDGIQTLNRQRNKKVKSEAIELANLLNRIGVIPVFLKGGADLVSGLYADPAHRVMIDLDVLVPNERLPDCVAGLRANGYEVLGDNDFPAHHHFAPLGRPGAAACIELHVEPLDRPLRGLLGAAEVLAGAVAIHEGSAILAVPSPHCRVIHSVAHAQLADHGYVYGNLMLREFFDLAQFSRAFAGQIDWDAINGRFALFGSSTALGFHVLAAERLLDVQRDQRVQVSLAAKALYARARWQVDRPAWRNLHVRLLRPWLLLRRSLSLPVLRQRLLRKLGDGNWYRRQWRMLWPASRDH
jgi:hypothetical protein